MAPCHQRTTVGCRIRARCFLLGDDLQRMGDDQCHQEQAGQRRNLPDRAPGHSYSLN